MKRIGPAAQPSVNERRRNEHVCDEHLIEQVTGETLDPRTHRHGIGYEMTRNLV